EFLCFLPQDSCFCLQLYGVYGGGHHAEPVLRFARLFPAEAYLVAKILLRFRIVCLPVVFSHTTPRGNSMLYQRTSHRSDGDFLGERDDLLPEASSPFFEIERFQVSRLAVVVAQC